MVVKFFPKNWVQIPWCCIDTWTIRGHVHHYFIIFIEIKLKIEVFLCPGVDEVTHHFKLLSNVGNLAISESHVKTYDLVSSFCTLICGMGMKAICQKAILELVACISQLNRALRTCPRGAWHTNEASVKLFGDVDSKDQIIWLCKLANLTNY